ncbi:hypothetical protein FACS1894122_00730 [Alphaproteobacteria bacterium]|nr:hypothetical protein FACS1894122_00730 [Alphaproteobacteria bacterium]
MWIIDKIKHKNPRINSIKITETQPISRLFGFDRGTPIDRYYIEKFLKENQQYIKGTVLEISENTYSRKFSSGMIKQEILHFDNTNLEATIIGDLTDTSTLPENAIDCFICTQTFNFIYDVKKALIGTRFLLKEGGVLLATVGGLSQISRYDMDRWGHFWSFTNKSIEMLAKDAGFREIQIITYGNVAAATAFIQGLAQEDLSDISILDRTDEDYQVTIGLRAIK